MRNFELRDCRLEVQGRCSAGGVAGAGPGAAAAVQAGDQEAVRHRAQAAVPHRAPPAVQVRTFILSYIQCFENLLELSHFNTFLRIC